MSDFPQLAELSLNDSNRPASRRPTTQLHSNSRHHTLASPTYQMQGHGHPHRHSWSNQHQSQWSVPGWQSTLEFASNSIYPLHSSTCFEDPLWDSFLLHPKLTMESLFLPRLSLPDLDLASSPSTTSSSVYSDLSPSPPPSLHVVCDIPVVAPRPLPYHSPTFLQFDLPDVDEDLSRPPYTRGPTTCKRKAADDLVDPTRLKRHTASPGRRSPRSLSATHLAVQGKETRAGRRHKKR